MLSVSEWTWKDLLSPLFSLASGTHARLMCQSSPQWVSADCPTDKCSGSRAGLADWLGAGGLVRWLNCTADAAQGGLSSSIVREKQAWWDGWWHTPGLPRNGKSVIAFKWASWAWTNHICGKKSSSEIPLKLNCRSLFLYIFERRIKDGCDGISPNEATVRQVLQTLINKIFY